MGVVLVGLGLSAGDDEPTAGEGRETTTTTARRTTTSRRPTTTTTYPLGPVFPEPVGASLLVQQPWGRAVVVDLDTGVRRDIDLRGRDLYSAVAVRNGIVVIDESDGQAYSGDLLSTAEPTWRPLGPASRVMAGDSVDAVWLIDAQPAGDHTELVPGHAQLVDLRGNVLTEFDVPPAWFSGATGDGLVYGRGGRVYLVDAGGSRAVAAGDLLGVVAAGVVVQSCDDKAACSISVVRTGGAGSIRLDVTPPPEGAEVFAGPDGGFALADYSSSDVWFFDANGRWLGQLGGWYGAWPVPLPREGGMLLANGGPPEWVHRDGDEWVRTNLDALESLPADYLLVITP